MLAYRLSDFLPKGIVLDGAGKIMALHRETDKRPAHLAFVVEWPSVVHANARAGTILDDGETNRALKKRFLGFYRFKEWE